MTRLNSSVVVRMLFILVVVELNASILLAHGGGGFPGGGNPRGRVSETPRSRPPERQAETVPRSAPNVEVKDVQKTLDQGIEWANQGNLKEAIPLLEKMAIIDPESYRAHLALGGAYLAQRDYLKAQKAFETAERLEPALVSTNFALGLLNEKLGKHHVAAQQWKQFLMHGVDEKARQVAEKHLAHQMKHLKK